MKFDNDFDRLGERLGTYAFLKTAEEHANSDYQRMQGRHRNAASRAAQAASYIRPEILAISPTKMKKFLAAKELAPYRLLLERVLRYKPHTLSDREEQAAGHAGRDGQAGRQDLPPVERRRPEVRH